MVQANAYKQTNGVLNFDTAPARSNLTYSHTALTDEFWSGPV